VHRSVHRDSSHNSTHMTALACFSASLLVCTLSHCTVCEIHMSDTTDATSKVGSLKNNGR
jgi:hypothetical protein